MKGHNIFLKIFKFQFLKSLSVIIDKNLILFCVEKDVKRVFITQSMVPFGSFSKLISYLVLVQVYTAENDRFM